MRAVFSRHRDLARASFARIPLGENALRGSEWMIGLMRAGGLADQVIAYACDLLPLYVMAIAYEESLYDHEDRYPRKGGSVHQRHAHLFRLAAARALPQPRLPGRSPDRWGQRCPVRIRARRARPRAGRRERLS